MKDKKRIVVLPGDGIGKEVTAEAIKVLKRIEQLCDHSFDVEQHEIGGTSIDNHGTPITDETLIACKTVDAVLLGAVGGDEWNDLPLQKRPEHGLLALRKELGCYVNLRPIKLFSCLRDMTPFHSRIVSRGIDLLIIRELLHGLYYGDRGCRLTEEGERVAYDTAVCTETSTRRVAHLAFQLAVERKGSVTSFDKSNILETSRLWRDIVTEVRDDYPDCILSHELIDSGAMHIISSPSDFDVLLLNNEYGDIISDEASVFAASLAMVPSASFADNGPHLYEPIHGSAPDIAGENIANPVGAILSAALLLRYSFRCEQEAMSIENAVESVLAEGARTKDLSSVRDGSIGTSEFGDRVVRAIEKAA